MEPLPSEPNPPVHGPAPLAFVASSVHELGLVDWPRRTVLQHSAVVVAVLVLLLSLVLAVDAAGTALMTWVTG